LPERSAEILVSTFEALLDFVQFRDFGLVYISQGRLGRLNVVHAIGNFRAFSLSQFHGSFWAPVSLQMMHIIVLGFLLALVRQVNQIVEALSIGIAAYEGLELIFVKPDQFTNGLRECV
jgi:hypothetical protein